MFVLQIKDNSSGNTSNLMLITMDTKIISVGCQSFSLIPLLHCHNPNDLQETRPAKNLV